MFKLIPLSLDRVKLHLQFVNRGLHLDLSGWIERWNRRIDVVVLFDSRSALRESELGVYCLALVLNVCICIILQASNLVLKCEIGDNFSIEFSLQNGYLVICKLKIVYQLEVLISVECLFDCVQW